MNMHNSDSNNDLDYLEDLSLFWKAVSFLFPIAGIIIYVFQRNKGETKKAKAGITAAIAGMILNVLMLLTRSYL